MRQQIAFEYAQTQNGQRLIQRKTIAPPGQGTYVQYQTANPHRAGHYAGLHPEDQPYWTDDLDDTQTHVPARTMPRSAIRYRPTTPQQQATPKKRMHYLFWVGVVLFIMIFGWIGLTALGSWWQTTLDDWHYGRPRTFQTDQNVGHFGFVSHFVALNLNGKIEVIETEPANPNQQQATHMYIVATLDTDQNLQPVTLRFENLTGNGRLDLLVFVGNSLQVPLYNTGTGFQSQPPGNH
jgi:hypothetical protein